ncbi:U3 snoRNP protein, partial [Irineochytrium annulatum]
MDGFDDDADELMGLPTSKTDTKALKGKKSFELDPDLEEDEDGDGDLNEDEEAEDDEEDTGRPRGRVTEVDDEFFSLEEMERFAEKGEMRDLRRDEDKDDDEEFDLGFGYLGMDPDDLEASDDEEDDGMNANEIRYADFFEPPNKLPKGAGSKRGVRFNDNVEERTFKKDAPASPEEEDAQDDTTGAKKGLFDDDDGAAAKSEQLSTFERNQARIAKQIAALEAEAMDEKPWALRGEVSSKARPVNSLLEEDLDIEHASRPAPTVTEDTTRTLEDMIKQRVLDALFDDVERRYIVKKKEFDPNRGDVINEEKSSRSLADVYEDEYVREREGATHRTEKDEMLEKAHKEIDALFDRLVLELDALANWHYTPRAPRVELEVVPAPHVPALEVEEVTPATVSDAKLAAPEEVYAAGKSGKAVTEMDSKDRKRQRLRMKRQHRKEREARERDNKARDKALGVSADSGVVKETVKRGKERAVGTLMKQRNVT